MGLKYGSHNQEPYSECEGTSYRTNPVRSGGAYENTVLAVTATVAVRLPDIMFTVPATPAPGDVRATIVVVLQDTRVSGRTPMFAVTCTQSAPNLVPAQRRARPRRQISHTGRPASHEDNNHVLHQKIAI
jgi:hypothetical protein